MHDTGSGYIRSMSLRCLGEAGVDNLVPRAFPNMTKVTVISQCYGDFVGPTTIFRPIQQSPTTHGIAKKIVISYLIPESQSLCPQRFNHGQRRPKKKC